MKTVVIPFILALFTLISCNPYIPRTPYISTIEKSKEVEVGGGGSLHFIYKGAYANAGVGITNFMSLHGSGDYTISGVHLDGKVRFYKAIRKVRLNTEFGYAWNFSEPLNFSFAGRWLSGNYQAYFNQTYVSYENKEKCYTIGLKYGKLSSEYTRAYRESQEQYVYKIESTLVEPFIHYSKKVENPMFGERMNIGISYSNAYLSIMKDDTPVSRNFSDVLGTLSVGTQIVF